MSIFLFSENTFADQLPDEKTILLTRKHWFTLFVPLLIVFVLGFLPFVIYSLVEVSLMDMVQWYAFVPSAYWFLMSIYFLALWHLAFYNIMIYSLNTIVVTNKRIIENKQQGFFRHTVNELELDRIQDISTKVFGPIAEFLNFGNIEIQTAGAKGKFHLTRLPDPKKIRKAIKRNVSKKT